MGNFPDPGPDVVRLPPTRPPKRRTPRPRWVRPVGVALALVMTAVLLAAVLNREVDKRLATVPPASTSPTTTTTIPVAPTTPVTSTHVLGSRVTRPAEPAPTTTTSSTIEPQVMQAETPSALIAELEKLPVEEEHADGYRRAQFGFSKDADGDRCDTRKEVLIDEAIELVMNTYNCNIQTGKWFSPFDGATVGLDLVRATHIVALREAWESGAWQWTDPERNAFLNDLTHEEAMLAVSTQSDDARKDRDPGGWQPPNKDFRCDYLKTWVYVKTLYKLSVDPGEREAIAAAALHC